MDDAAPTPQPVEAAPTPARPPARGIRISATAWIALGITAIVVVATLVVLLAGNQAQASYPADSPESALQRYLTVWYDKDYDAAYDLFSADAKSQMPEIDFREQAGYGFGATNQTVTLEQVSGSGDSRTLSLSVEDFYGPDFGGSGYSHEVIVQMQLETDGWKIDQPLIGLEPYYGYDYPF